MGISGLIPFVENATSQGHISHFKGQRVAVDVSCLLHRAVYGCVDQIAQNIETDFCIKFIQKQLMIFKDHRCPITLVFDGQALPAKEEINNLRRQQRESNKELGNELLKQGRKSEARAVFQKGIGIPKKVVEDAIRYFNAQPDVNVIVAPYEADAQLAYLIQEGFVDVVVTQDSDLIVFNCGRIIYKFESSGSCMIFDGSRLHTCLNRPLCDNFKFEVFRRMCILSGCDYLDGGLHGVGLKKAEKFFAKTTLTDPEKFLPRVVGFLNLKGAKVDKQFIDRFIKAENTFKYQIVYDPKLKIQLPLTLYPNTQLSDYLNFTDQIKELSETYWYAGRIAHPELAIRLATGQSTSIVGSFPPKVSDSQDEPKVLDPRPVKRASINSAPPRFATSSSSSLSMSNASSVSASSSRKRLSLSNPVPRIVQTQFRAEASSSTATEVKRFVLGKRNSVVMAPNNSTEEDQLAKIAKIGNGRLFDTGGDRRSTPTKLTFTTVQVDIPGLVRRPFKFSVKQPQELKSTLFVSSDGSENQAPETLSTGA